MNKRIHLLYGLIIGLILAFLGAYLFVIFFTKLNFTEGVEFLKRKGELGKLISLGAIPNLIAFFVLLKMKKEMLARGVVLATIILAISTIFYL